MADHAGRGSDGAPETCKASLDAFGRGRGRLDMTLREFLAGPPSYVRTASQGSPWILLPVGFAILAIGQAGPALVIYLLDAMSAQPQGPQPPGLPAPGVDVGRRSLPQGTSLMGLTLASQALTLALTVLVAARIGLSQTLKLDPPAGGWIACLWALVAMVPLVAAFNVIAYALAPGMMVEDFRAFRTVVQSGSVWTTGLVLSIGAPLWEEAFFRGYLLSTLSALSLGFWPAAALASLAWAALHLEYSAVGFLEVFLIGVYFSWLLWRTGSLWPALVCHGVYNGALFAFLRLVL